MASSEEQRGDMQIQGGKKLRADWELNLGDNLLSIHPIQYESCAPSILILCERSIVCVLHTVKIRFIRRLDFHPSCLHLYGAVGDKIRYIVSSYDGYLFVYHDGTLQWAAQLENIPIAIGVANLNHLSGVIVTLSDVGKLACSYLGTEPPKLSITEQESRPVDYEAISKEMKVLQKEITTAESGSSTPDLNVQEMEVSVLVGDDINHEDVGEETGQSLTIVTAHVTISNLVKSPLRNIALSFIATAPLFVQPPFTQLEELEPQGKSTRDVSVILNQNMLPSSRQFSLSISYTSINGTPKYISKSIQLPFALFVESCKPSKDGRNKITLETNIPNAPLLELFNDVITASDDTLPPNAIGFKLFSNSQPTLTIVVAKSSSKYRMQTDHIEVMWLFIEVLKERLELFLANSDTSNKPLEFTFNEELPLKDYFIAIDTHFEARINQLQLREILSDYAKQFRCIQKRILTRLKDKTPSPLNNLDVLLDGTYRQLLAIGNAEEQAAFKRSTCANMLSCTTRLVQKLLEISHDLTPEECHVISQALSTDVEVNGDISWEEKTDIAIIYLLKTSLSRSSKDSSLSFPGLEIPRDTSKLKKHISLICDRIAKGCRPKVIKLAEFNTSFSKKLETDTASTE